MNLIEDTFKFCKDITITDITNKPIRKIDSDLIIRICKGDPGLHLKCSQYDIGNPPVGAVEYGILFDDQCQLPGLCIHGYQTDRTIRSADYGMDYRFLTVEEIESLVILLEAYAL